MGRLFVYEVFVWCSFLEFIIIYLMVLFGNSDGCFVFFGGFWSFYYFLSSGFMYGLWFSWCGICRCYFSVCIVGGRVGFRLSRVWGSGAFFSSRRCFRGKGIWSFEEGVGFLRIIVGKKEWVGSKVWGFCYFGDRIGRDLIFK